MSILEYIFIAFAEYSYYKANFLSLQLYFYIDLLLSFLKHSLTTCWTLLIGTYGVEAVVMSIKFLTSIALLIFIRGGIPRYRFDHLTRIGWVKFLTLVVCFLLIELLFLYTLMS